MFRPHPVYGNTVEQTIEEIEEQVMAAILHQKQDVQDTTKTPLGFLRGFETKLPVEVEVVPSLMQIHDMFAKQLAFALKRVPAMLKNLKLETGQIALPFKQFHVRTLFLRSLLPWVCCHGLLQPVFCSFVEWNIF